MFTVRAYLARGVLRVEAEITAARELDELLAASKDARALLRSGRNGPGLI